MRKKFLRILMAVLCLTLTLGVFVACDGDKDTDGGKQDAGADIYEIKYKGVSVELGGKASTALKALGDPVSEQPTGNCGGLGETTRYDYSAFVMVVVDYESGAKVDSIEFKSDLVETSGGIYIGSSESAVRSAYGEPDETIKNTLVYRDGDRELAISISDGAVKTIVFRCV